MKSHSTPSPLPVGRLLCLVTPLLLVSAVSCKKSEPTATAAPAKQAVSPDVPVLPVKIGDTWRYSVQVEMPSAPATASEKERQITSELTRRYIGKIKPANDLPEVDCFEVSAPSVSPIRELVEIKDNIILMRGSITMGQEPSAPIWLEPGVPFVFADMKAGDTLREVHAGSEKNVRNLQVVAREEVTVPAGTYQAVRMLMTGVDNGIELRRTIWFAFGTGIVREEKMRYGGDKLLVREVQELLEKSNKP